MMTPLGSNGGVTYPSVMRLSGNQLDRSSSVATHYYDIHWDVVLEIGPFIVSYLDYLLFQTGRPALVSGQAQSIGNVI
jgi:hypothetical protein